MSEEEVYSILKNNNNVLDHGEHEWDNSWLGGIQVIAEGITRSNYTLIGWFTLIQPKHYAEGIDLDIGIVCEDSDGVRFWCHYSSRWLKDDLATYEEMHGINGGKKDESQ